MPDTSFDDASMTVASYENGTLLPDPDPVEKPAPVKTEPAESESESDSSESETPVEPPKIDKRTREGRKASIQQEIDDLTRAKYDTRREVEQAHAELARLRAERSALDQRPATSAPSATEGTPQTEPRPQPASVPDWKRYLALPDAPTADQFETYDDFMAARAQFIADRRYEDREQESRQRQSVDSMTQAHFGRLQRARDDAALGARLSSVPADMETSRPINDYIVRSELGPELLVHLSEHSDIRQRILTLHPIEQIRQMGILEGTLQASAAVHSGPAVTPNVSKARPPIKPVGSAPVASGDDLDTSDESLSIEEHIRRENRRDRQVRSRR